MHSNSKIIPDPREALIEEIDAFLAETGIRKSTLCKRAGCRVSAITELRAGYQVTLQTAGKIVAFLNDERQRRQEAEYRPD